MLVTAKMACWMALAAGLLLVLGLAGVLVWGWRKKIAFGQMLAQRWRTWLNGICWVAAVLVAAKTVEYAWKCDGHVTCDFAGQWLIGRMMGQGRGHQLYLVSPEREVLAQGYQGNELEWMYRDILLKGMWNSQGNGTVPKSEIEGPLYPPSWGLVTMLWAWLPPEPAHRVVVLVYAILGFVAAWCVRIATDGHLRAGEAALAIWLFPNCYHGLVLGQNALFTVFLIAAGLALWKRQQFWAAGLVWGLLAYKPVFFAALLWVPLVLGTWRLFAGMLLSSGMLALASVPFLLPPVFDSGKPEVGPADYRTFLQRIVFWDKDAGGWRVGLTGERIGRAWEVWRRWWQVGRRATEVYDRDENWVWMSRDLYALARRPIWDWPTLLAHWRFGWGHEYWPGVQDEHGKPLPTWRWERPNDEQNRGSVLVVRKDGTSIRLQEVNGERHGIFFGFRLPVTLISWFFLIAVGGLTAGILMGLSWWRKRRHLPTLALFPSPAGAFLITGALLTCFHFMHYDLHPLVLPLLFLVASCLRSEWWEWESDRTWPRLSWLFGRGLAVLSVTLLVASWLACYYNLAFQRGAVRFPFETCLALIQWLAAGVWTVLECWPRRWQPHQTPPQKSHFVAVEVLGGWSPQATGAG